MVVLRGLAGTLVDANGAATLSLDGQAVASSIEVVGAPGGTGTSTLEVFGPLLLQMPFELPADGEVILLQDANGGTVILEFDENQIPVNPNATLISITGNETQDALAALVVDAINLSGAGINATTVGSGQISLGRIPSGRVMSPIRRLASDAALCPTAKF